MPSESEIISIIRRRARKQDGVIVGIGDDAAVVRPSSPRDLIACCDLMVEGVHFRREWAPPKLIGRKALASTLSDVAAMGALARFAMISVALPSDCSSEFVDELFEGVCELADSFNVSIVGGDTSSSPASLFLDTTVIGECEPGRAVTRSGAHAGDAIYVTGELGASALGLALLERGMRLGDCESNGSSEMIERSHREALMKHLAPVPRLGIGRALGERGLATAMIDVSDGLSTDLSHLLDESRVGAVIQADAIPIARCVELLASGSTDLDPLQLALHGGEEYELLFTCLPQHQSQLAKLSRELGISISHIGDIVAEKGLQLERNGNREIVSPAGFEHGI
ncbi:MAG: thiamine-phosphate kinase [Acidobacteriota bacterium]